MPKLQITIYLFTDNIETLVILKIFLQLKRSTIHNNNKIKL